VLKACVFSGGFVGSSLPTAPIRLKTHVFRLFLRAILV
jgi:hypothetical protein